MTDTSEVTNLSLNLPYCSVDADLDTVFDNPSVLFVGTGGDLEVQLYGDPDGTTRIYKNIPDGTELSPRIKKIISTGTTASDFVVHQ
jgi:hypothetical protein